jgi:hypothetical protein
VVELDSLLKLTLKRSFIIGVYAVANNSGAFPLTYKKGKRGQLQWQTLWKNEQLFLTLEQLVKHEGRNAGNRQRSQDK